MPSPFGNIGNGFPVTAGAPQGTQQNWGNMLGNLASRFGNRFGQGGFRQGGQVQTLPAPAPTAQAPVTTPTPPAQSPSIGRWSDDATKTAMQAFVNSPERVARREQTYQMMRDRMGQLGQALANVQDTPSAPGVSSPSLRDVLQNAFNSFGDPVAAMQAADAAWIENNKPTGTVDPQIQAFITRYLGGG